MRALNLIVLTLLGAGVGGYLLDGSRDDFTLKGAIIGALVVGVPTLLIMLKDLPLYKSDK